MVIAPPTRVDHIHIVGSMAMLSGELASSNCRPVLLRLKQEMQKLLQAEKAWITESRNTLLAGYPLVN